MGSRALLEDRLKGLLGGIFPTDPVSGYPPVTPDQLPGYTWHGALHDLFSLPGFAALAAACFVFGWRFAGRGKRGWAVYSFFTGLAFTVVFAFASAGFGQAESLVDLAGLFHRVAITVGFGWLTLLALCLLQSSSES